MAGFDLVTDPDVIEGYLVDASNTRGSAEALARPRSADEVAALVRHCQQQGIPLTVTAQRTSTTAAPVPRGGWLLSTEHLRAVVSDDEVEGGVILGEHQAALEARGLHFPPDPTSRFECAIGAAIACNASGARSFRYGPTRPWITWAEVVLPTGDIVRADRSTPPPAHWPLPDWTEPCVKTAAGFYPADNLLDLIIGSEGTLGIVTRAGLRLLPAPVDRLGAVAFFVDEGALLSFVDRARTGARRPWRAEPQPGALDPVALEYLDRHALDLVRAAVPDLPADAEHAVFIELEHDGDPPLDLLWDALVDCGALAEATIVADDDRGRERLRQVRHAVPAGVNEIVVGNGMPKVGTDFAVPDAALPQMLAAYRAVPMRHVLFGHIGDNHLHLNLLPASSAELERARELYRELALRAVALGGTVSAEHGIGKLKRGLLAEMVGPEVLARFEAVKRAADPAWILGRGTMLAPPDAA